MTAAESNGGDPSWWRRRSGPRVDSPPSRRARSEPAVGPLSWEGVKRARSGPAAAERGAVTPRRRAQARGIRRPQSRVRTARPRPSCFPVLVRARRVCQPARPGDSSGCGSERTGDSSYDPSGGHNRGTAEGQRSASRARLVRRGILPDSKSDVATARMMKAQSSVHSYTHRSNVQARSEKTGDFPFICRTRRTLSSVTVTQLRTPSIPLKKGPDHARVGRARTRLSSARPKGHLESRRRRSRRSLGPLCPRVQTNDSAPPLPLSVERLLAWHGEQPRSKVLPPGNLARALCSWFLSSPRFE